MKNLLSSTTNTTSTDANSTWRVKALVITGDGGGTAHEAVGYYSWNVRTNDYF